MIAARSLALVMVLALLAVVGVPPLHGQEQEAQEPLTTSEESAEPAATEDVPVVDVEFSRKGSMRMLLKEQTLQLETPYGKLTIPVKDILRVEFATRLAESETKSIEESIAKLASTEFTVRETATRQLAAFGERAYPALVKATKDSDAEVAQRAKAMVTKLQETTPAERLIVREHDVVETKHSKIAGNLRTNTIAVETTEFGAQQLRLSDLRSMYSQGARSHEVAYIKPEPDPGNLLRFQTAIGKTLAFQVTGRLDGSCYGTGVYTTDSALATAAVHAGILKPGETAVIHVRMEESPESFVGSSQNGITSSTWGVYPAAYRVLRKGPSDPEKR